MIFGRKSSLLIIRPSPPVAAQQWNDLVAWVPCVTVEEPRGAEQGEQIISPHRWYRRPPHPTTSPAPGGRGRERSSTRPWRTRLQLSCGGSAHAPLSRGGCPAEEDTQSGQFRSTDTDSKKKSLNTSTFNAKDSIFTT